MTYLQHLIALRGFYRRKWNRLVKEGNRNHRNGIQDSEVIHERYSAEAQYFSARAAVETFKKFKKEGKI